MPMIGGGYDRSAMEQPIRYATSADGTSIAWTQVGTGEVEVAWLGGFVGHLEIMVEQPRLKRFLDRLGALAPVVVYHKRGQGPADRPSPAATGGERAPSLLARTEAPRPQ